MKGIWLVSQLKQLHMFGIRNIYHCGSMVFPGIAIDANSYNYVNNDWQYFETSCGLNRNPALRIDKYPLYPDDGTRFQTQVRIQILHLSFVNYLSHHVLTNYSIYICLCQQIIFECHLVVFECHLVVLQCYIPYLNFWNYSRTSLISNSRPRICCQFTQTLYHCAKEDQAHVLLFFYLYLISVWNF